MKHSRPAQPVARQKPHVRRVVAYLRARGAIDVVVTAPKHYRVTWEMTRGGPRHEIVVATTPRCADDEVQHSKRAIRRMLDAVHATCFGTT